MTIDDLLKRLSKDIPFYERARVDNELSSDVQLAVVNILFTLEDAQLECRREKKSAGH